MPKEEKFKWNEASRYQVLELGEVDNVTTQNQSRGRAPGFLIIGAETIFFLWTFITDVRRIEHKLPNHVVTLFFCLSSTKKTNKSAIILVV